VPWLMVWSVVTVVTATTCSEEGTTSISGTGKAATRGWLPGALTQEGISAKITPQSSLRGSAP
jgi:hypothetical protein